jgi:two-component system, chemotaxis family, protein-glutamate methylesterase/glutaminase
MAPTGTSELEQEREELVRAEQDVAEGRDRLERQRELLLRLRLSGASLTQAQRLEAVLQTTLEEWIRHRDHIRRRIAYLESRKELPLPGSIWQQEQRDA